MSDSSNIAADEDRRFLDAALRLARKHQGLTGTNPSVSCVIVAGTLHGKCIVGSGVTQKGGRPHAEPIALREAGDLAKDATAYVTLEPCAHHGKTPPCAQTLIDAGITRVVTAITDPDNRVNGKGHEMLEAAGIEVVMMDGGKNAKRVLKGYLKSRTANRPYIALKIAMGEDGLIGVRGKGNHKITGPIARGETHLIRARHNAILVGSKTVRVDDPGLGCRLPGLNDRSPIRIVLDGKSKITPQFQVVANAPQNKTIFVGPQNAPQSWKGMLHAHSIQHLSAEMDCERIALPEMFGDLAQLGIQSVMVEAGANLSKILIEEDLVDEIILHIGGEPDALSSGEEGLYAHFTPSTLPSNFEICQKQTFGADISLRLLRK